MMIGQLRHGPAWRRVNGRRTRFVRDFYEALRETERRLGRELTRPERKRAYELAVEGCWPHRLK
jgi:hypothetical protein